MEAFAITKTAPDSAGTGCAMSTRSCETAICTSAPRSNGLRTTRSAEIVVPTTTLTKGEGGSFENLVRRNAARPGRMAPPLPRITERSSATLRPRSLTPLRQKSMAQLAFEEFEEQILLRSDLSQDQVVETGVDILADGLQVS